MRIKHKSEFKKALHIAALQAKRAELVCIREVWNDQLHKAKARALGDDKSFLGEVAQGRAGWHEAKSMKRVLTKLRIDKISAEARR